MTENEEKEVAEAQIVKIILALDVGSSSIRCSPYEYICEQKNEDKDTLPVSSTLSASSTAVKAVQGCSSVRKVASVRPNTGKIVLIHEREGEEGRGKSSATVATSLFDEIDHCIDESLNLLRSNFNNNDHNPFQIIGIGISSFVMNFIGIDSKGQIINELSTLSYACNSPEVVQECSKLKQELGEEKLKDLYQRTGTPLHNAYALAQLRVFYNNIHKQKNDEESSILSKNSNIEVKDEFVSVDQWTTIASYCIQRWTGKGNNPISFSEASWTGLFNFHTCQWDDSCCQLLPAECIDSLPSVADFTSQHYFIEEYVETNNCNGRRIRNPYWERWPELRGANADPDKDAANEHKSQCQIFLGIGDGICANIGSKCSSSERIACTIGTSAAARLCIPYKTIPSEKCENYDGFDVQFGLFCYRIDNDHILLGGALTDGGSIVEFLRKLLNLKSDESFSLCLKDAALTYANEIQNNKLKDQLSVIPFLSGERSTGFRGGATGCILGLTRDTSASDVLRSSLESVVLRLHHIMELIQNSCPKKFRVAKCIVASGNALERNSLWRQMLSDCTGKIVVKDGDAHEGTSRGVAILVSKNIFNNKLTTMNQEQLAIEEEESPNPISKSYWLKQKENQESAIQSISPIWE